MSQDTMLSSIMGWEMAGPHSLSAFSVGLVLLCNPKVLEANGPVLRPEDLANHVLIHETAHDWWADWLKCAGVPSLNSKRRIILDDPIIVIKAGIEGQGFILAPIDFVRTHLL